MTPGEIQEDPLPLSRGPIPDLIGKEKFRMIIFVRIPTSEGVVTISAKN